MAAPDTEDLEGLAAEFVLGTLSPQERLDTIYRLRTDPDLKRKVDEWTERLGPLADGLPPMTPSAGLEERIMVRIAALGGTSSIVALQKAVIRWRSAALLFAALSAALGALVVWLSPQYAGPNATGPFVATLQADGTGPAFVAVVDLEKSTIAIRRTGEGPPTGKSFELWAIGGGRAEPQSLGVVDAVARLPAATLGSLDPSTIGDTLFAITVEPSGGSPTGKPSGAPIYSGKLIPTQ